MHIYSGSIETVWRGKSFISKVKNLAPFVLSDITLLSKKLAYNKDAAGEEESPVYF